MEDKIIVIFERTKTGECYDLEIPLSITANELIFSLNMGLHLGIHMDDVSQCYLTAENPVALIRGEVLLEQLGLRNGTRIIYTR